MDRVSIKTRAKEQINNKIFQLLAIYLVIIAASCLISIIFGLFAGIINFILSGPVALSLATVYLGIIKKSRTPDVEDVIIGFKDNQFGRSLITYIRYKLFAFLWSLLLVIPGIIKSISYSQMFYLIAEDKKLEPGKAQKKSMEMMEGHKADYFVLILSFIPWFLLCAVTLGLAAIYVVPYYQATMAEFHVRLVKENKPITKVVKAVKKSVKEATAKTTAKKSVAKSTSKKPAAKKTTAKKSTKK